MHKENIARIKTREKPPAISLKKEDKYKFCSVQDAKSEESNCR